MSSRRTLLWLSLGGAAPPGGGPRSIRSAGRRPPDGGHAAAPPGGGPLLHHARGGSSWWRASARCAWMLGRQCRQPCQCCTSWWRGLQHGVCRPQPSWWRARGNTSWWRARGSTSWWRALQHPILRPCSRRARPPGGAPCRREAGPRTLPRCSRPLRAPAARSGSVFRVRGTMSPRPSRGHRRC